MQTISLSESDISRFWAKVEKTEQCWLWRAAASAGYGRFSIVYSDGRKGMLAAHRVAYTLLRGEIPEGLVLDHKCHQPSCVNPKHLRPVTVKQNAEHRRGANANSSTGIHGVYWRKDRSKWEVRVRHDSRTRAYGMYLTIEEAEAVATAVRNRLYTHNDADRLATA